MFQNTNHTNLDEEYDGLLDYLLAIEANLRRQQQYIQCPEMVANLIVVPKE